jgi:glycosyltransferase involved in cell wall biosynthesis
MLHFSKVAIIIPVYNEQNHILKVIENVPSFVDYIIIVNDGSTDRSVELINAAVKRFNTLNFILLSHSKNLGKGASIKTGYNHSLLLDVDCIATIDGDNQMNQSELEKICFPIVSQYVDYSKGNRLKNLNSIGKMPKTRLLGNLTLTYLTRLVSGYWQLMDTQTGYTAISRSALKRLDFSNLLTYYGYNNHLLIKLNINNCSITEVEIESIYNDVNDSKMNIWKLIPILSTLLLKEYFNRFYIKYFLKKN